MSHAGNPARAGGGSYGSTGGSDTRAPRAMIASLMQFSLRDEIELLRSEPEYLTGDRDSRTLAKEADLRVLLSVLRAGAALDEQDGDARATIQVLDGAARVAIAGAEIALGPGQLAVVDAGRPWLISAESDCAVLLTIAWPPQKAGV